MQFVIVNIMLITLISISIFVWQVDNFIMCLCTGQKLTKKIIGNHLNLDLDRLVDNKITQNLNIINLTKRQIKLFSSTSTFEQYPFQVAC